VDINKLFTMKEPCKDCPFVKDGHMHRHLHRGRMEEIVESLNNDAPFHCHKTIDYSKPTHRKQVDDAVYCAGALIYMVKSGHYNLPMKLGMFYKLFDPAAMRGHDKVIEPLGLDKNKSRRFHE
jgi:hypothetical protein